jgi:hypothetical protein
MIHNATIGIVQSADKKSGEEYFEQEAIPVTEAMLRDLGLPNLAFSDQTIDITDDNYSFYAKQALVDGLREEWRAQNGYGSIFNRMKYIRANNSQNAKT